MYIFFLIKEYIPIPTLFYPNFFLLMKLIVIFLIFLIEIIAIPFQDNLFSIGVSIGTQSLIESEGFSDTPFIAKTENFQAKNVGVQLKQIVNRNQEILLKGSPRFFDVLFEEKLSEEGMNKGKNESLYSLKPMIKEKLEVSDKQRLGFLNDLTKEIDIYLI